MKTFFAFLAVLLVSSLVATAQKEDNVWIYAGNRIDFSTKPPTVTKVGCDYTTEVNITSVADSEGRLVYWLNGTSLYNSKDEVVYSLPVGTYAVYMYGLSIVPFPGRENVYLFVYPDVERDRMVVSIADGSKDLLHPKITERFKEFPYKLSANVADGVPFFFQKYNSRDFWLLYSYNNKIKVYALTEEGFVDTGDEYDLPLVDRLHYYLDGCEMTPDRSKILATTTLYGLSVFIDLDTKTGKIQKINPISIYSMAAFAFSSGNKYMYYTFNSHMYRIPVESLAVISTDEQFLENSELVGYMGVDAGDIKFLTSGGVYYMPMDGEGYLGMVSDCESDYPKLNNHAISMAQNVVFASYSSFLAFPKTYCYPYGLNVKEMCGGEVRFSYSDSECESIHWDFGDGTSTTVNGQSVEHTYATNGKYTVTLSVNYANGRPQQTLEQTVTVKNILKKLVIVRE